MSKIEVLWMQTGMYDVHCHILPGVDDGADSLETSTAMLERERQQGVSHIILTPHFRRRMFEPSMETVAQQFQRLFPAAQEMGISLYLGCEFHANMDMVDTLIRRERPTLAGSRYVLTEFRGDSEEAFIRERTMSLLGAGFVPVVAHFERYRVLRRESELAWELKERGCLLQMNADTIAGREGWSLARFAKKMVRQGLVDLVGSDAHDLDARSCHMKEAAAALERWAGAEEAKRILCRNPQKIVADEKI